jgi:hypothetical protein
LLEKSAGFKVFKRLVHAASIACFQLSLQCLNVTRICSPLLLIT